MKNDTNVSNETSTVAKATELLAQWLGEDASAFEEARFDSYGLTVLEIGTHSYAVGTDAECDAACLSYIEDTAWAFNGEFVCRVCGLPSELAQALDQWRSDKSDDANLVMLRLINRCSSIEEFTRQAIAADGRGHFLASHDGDEIELGDGLFAYRIG